MTVTNDGWWDRFGEIEAEDDAQQAHQDAAVEAWLDSDDDSEDALEKLVSGETPLPKKKVKVKADEGKADDDEAPANPADTETPAVDQKDLAAFDEFLKTSPTDGQIDLWMKEHGMIAAPDIPATQPGAPAEELNDKLDELFKAGASDQEIDAAMKAGGAW